VPAGCLAPRLIDDMVTIAAPGRRTPTSSRCACLVGRSGRGGMPPRPTTLLFDASWPFVAGPGASRSASGILSSLPSPAPRPPSDIAA